jgi:hypothetical protein
MENKGSDNITFDIKGLISKIVKLTSKEKIHILNILKRHKIEHTKNSNGYFFNLETVDISILEKMFKIIELIETRREEICDLDKRRDEKLEFYKSLIEKKLNNTININKTNVLEKLFITDEMNFKKFIKKKLSKYKNFINKKDDSKIDYELLMKMQSKNKKYHKDTVYYRINEIIRTQNRSCRHIKSTPDDTSNTGDDRGGDDDRGDIDDRGDDVGDDGGDDVKEIEEDIEKEIEEDIEKEIEEDSDTEDEIGEYYHDEDEDDKGELKTINDDDDEDQENAQTDTPTETQTVTLSVSRKNKLDFYKALLNNKGFSFDYNKDVRMKEEEYIV